MLAQISITLSPEEKTQLEKILEVERLRLG